MNSQQIEELIANGNRLIREAQEALAASERFFAERNITPGDCMEEVRRLGGEAAVQAVEIEIAAAIREAEEEAQRRRMHMSKTSTAAGKRLRTRNMV